MNTEEQFKKRITELGRMSFARDIVMFSDFLDLNQQNIVRSIPWKQYGIQLSFDGGYEMAERKMAAFIPASLADLYPVIYPFQCLEISPVSAKYAEKLNHRDFMGSILALGVDRSRIGDIIVKDERAYFFCQENLLDFFTEELRMIRHTAVNVQLVDAAFTRVEPEMKEVTGSVASVRLDSIIALAFGTSRSSISSLIPRGNVQVNAKVITSAGYQVNAGDVISVRGFGKCRFAQVLNTTKKGREVVRLYKYV